MSLPNGFMEAEREWLAAPDDYDDERQIRLEKQAIIDRGLKDPFTLTREEWEFLGIDRFTGQIYGLDPEETLQEWIESTRQAALQELYWVDKRL